MKDFCVKDIVRAVGGSLLCGDENVQIDNFATNSGKAEPGLMFAPIVGERVDGHTGISTGYQQPTKDKVDRGRRTQRFCVYQSER